MAQDRDSKLIRAKLKDVYNTVDVDELVVDADRDLGEGDTDSYSNRSYFQHDGFYSIPRSESVVGAGDGDEIIFVKADNTYVAIASASAASLKPALTSEGDSCIYYNAEIFVAVLADGTVRIQSKGGLFLMEPDGVISMENDVGSIDMAADGTVDINGGNLTVDP